MKTLRLAAVLALSILAPAAQAAGIQCWEASASDAGSARIRLEGTTWTFHSRTYQTSEVASSNTIRVTVLATDGDCRCLRLELL
jgi:hypothetical protein